MTNHTPSDLGMESIALADALASVWGEDDPLFVLAIDKIVRAVNTYEALLEVAIAIVDQAKDGLDRSDWILDKAKQAIARAEKKSA